MCVFVVSRGVNGPELLIQWFVSKQGQVEFRVGGGVQGLKNSHLDTCLSSIAEASTWQFWEFLVPDRYCLKNNHKPTEPPI